MEKKTLYISSKNIQNINGEKKEVNMEYKNKNGIEKSKIVIKMPHHKKVVKELTGKNTLSKTMEILKKPNVLLK